MGVVRFKYCPKCGELFDCYCESHRRCWCFEVKLTQDTLNHLASSYSNCLCPKCLNEFSSGMADSGDLMQEKQN